MNKLIALPILLLLVSSCGKDDKETEENKSPATTTADKQKPEPKPEPAANKVVKEAAPVNLMVVTAENSICRPPTLKWER